MLDKTVKHTGGVTKCLIKPFTYWWGNKMLDKTVYIGGATKCIKPFP